MARIVAALCAAWLLLAGLGGCAWLDQTQRRLALRPTPTAPGAPPPALREGDVRYTVAVPVPDGPAQHLALWWLPHANAQAPVLLYLHGTFRNLPQNLPKMAALRDAGFAVLAVDYRGWGDSTAIVPTEETIYADAARAWAEMQRLAPDAPRRVIFGHSMGGAVAVHLAHGLRAGHDYGALILESTFTRMPDVAAATGWWGRLAATLTTLQFDSLSRIGQIDGPILIVHGEADRTVPVALGRRLRDAAKPGAVQYVEVAGGTHSRLHSEAPALYMQTMKHLIQQLPSPATRRTP